MVRLTTPKATRSQPKTSSFRGTRLFAPGFQPLLQLGAEPRQEPWVGNGLSSDPLDIPEAETTELLMTDLISERGRSTYLNCTLSDESTE